MRTPFLAMLLAVAWAGPAVAQASTPGPIASRVGTATPTETSPAPVAARTGEPLEGMALVLSLRAEGLDLMHAGRYEAAAAKFEESLHVLAAIPAKAPGHGTIGFFPHYLLFMPPLNF